MVSGIIRLDEGWRFDEGHHFDQPPNVPPIPAAATPIQKKGKHMDYVPPKRAERYLWLGNLSANVVAEAAKFGAPPADATAAKALADDLLAKMDATDTAAATLDGVRQIEKEAQQANLAGLRAKVRNWKTLPGYPASGSEGVLRLKGSEVVFDPSTYKPVLTVAIEAGQIRLLFKRGPVDALAFYGRLRGTIGWHKLGSDTTSPFIDSRPLAVPGAAEVREYLARGIVDDEEVGLDSDVACISYGG